MAKLLYQGHGSYRITTQAGTVIYVDPSLGEGYDAPADIVIVTHEHGDHNQVDKMPHSDGCVVLRPSDIQPKPGYYPSIFLREEGAQGKLKGIRITGVQAGFNEYHQVSQCVGVILELDDISFYAAGDTSTTDDMKSGKLSRQVLDYATFPTDGFFNMDVAEAIECAKLVQAKHSIPMHMVPVHDVEKAVLFDEEKAQAFDVEGRLIVRPGEEIQL